METVQTHGTAHPSRHVMAKQDKVTVEVRNDRDPKAFYSLEPMKTTAYIWAGIFNAKMGILKEALLQLIFLDYFSLFYARVFKGFFLYIFLCFHSG